VWLNVHIASGSQNGFDNSSMLLMNRFIKDGMMVVLITMIMPRRRYFPSIGTKTEFIANQRILSSDKPIAWCVVTIEKMNWNN